MAGETRFCWVELFGDYAERRFEPESSPQMLFVFEADGSD